MEYYVRGAFYEMLGIHVMEDILPRDEYCRLCLVAVKAADSSQQHLVVNDLLRTGWSHLFPEVRKLIADHLRRSCETAKVSGRPKFCYQNIVFVYDQEVNGQAKHQSAA